MKKRFISLILVLLMVFSLGVNAMAVGTSYSDVSPENWYYEYVTELSKDGVINGYSDGTFRPDETVTYAQALKLVTIAAGYGTKDQTGSHWASGYLSFALDKGFISGVTVEDLNREISRYEIAQLVAKALDVKKAMIANPFVDIFDDNVTALYAIGIFTGTVSDGELHFYGSASVKRAEISAIVYRIMNADIDRGDVGTEKVQKVLVTCSGGLNLRSEPNTSSEVLAILYKGAKAEFLGEFDGWYKVSYNSKVGYLSAEFCSVVEVDPTQADGVRGEIINYAQQFMGCPYVYGGSGPEVFDCSGFTMYVFDKFGYSLPHSAISQYQGGVDISKSELRPGDLVFFSNYSTDWIGHVGIYIGGGEFVHASSSYGVIISDMDSAWYSSHYVCSCRIIND